MTKLSPLRQLLKKALPQHGGAVPPLVKIPANVQREAQRGLELLAMGFQGGTTTGHNRAVQLTGSIIDLESLADMRAWFARHGPDASNGGTSYRGYRQWELKGAPKSGNLRAPIAWLIWGGDAAYLWLKTPKIQSLLRKWAPDRKEADSIDHRPI